MIIRTKEDITLQGKDFIPKGTLGIRYTDRVVNPGVYEYALENGVFAYLSNENIEIINNKKGEKMNITTLVRKILDKDIRTVMEAGYIDADLTLTKKGEDELMGILFLEKKAELVKAAEEELKERKKSK